MHQTTDITIWDQLEMARKFFAYRQLEAKQAAFFYCPYIPLQMVRPTIVGGP